MSVLSVGCVFHKLLFRPVELQQYPDEGLPELCRGLINVAFRAPVPIRWMLCFIPACILFILALLCFVLTILCQGVLFM